MSKITFTVELDTDQPSHLIAASMFLYAMNKELKGSMVTEVPGEKPKAVTPEKPTKAKPVPTSKVEETPAAQAAEEEAPGEEEEESAETQFADTKIKVEDIRILLAKKVVDHRDTIKAKLVALKANNVSNLAEASYAEFMDFLNSL